jgi:prolyl oligopeptidase
MLSADSADSDDRVDWTHARKLTVAIQHVTSGKAPVPLPVEKNAGHGCAEPVRQSIEKHPDMFAFLAKALHMRGPRGAC